MIAIIASSPFAKDQIYGRFCDDFRVFVKLSANLNRLAYSPK